MTDHLDPRITTQAPPRDERWLIVYLRLLALFFFCAGLYHWATLLSVPGFIGIDELDTPQQILKGYCAVIMLVASVGLWINASWGTVIWLMGSLSEIVAFTAFRDVFGGQWLLVGFHVLSLIGYLVLAWRVAKPNEE